MAFKEFTTVPKQVRRPSGAVHTPMYGIYVQYLHETNSIQKKLNEKRLRPIWKPFENRFIFIHSDTPTRNSCLRQTKRESYEFRRVNIIIII